MLIAILVAIGVWVVVTKFWENIPKQLIIQNKEVTAIVSAVISGILFLIFWKVALFVVLLYVGYLAYLHFKK